MTVDSFVCESETIFSLIRLQAARGLFTALDNCTDIVQITDNNHKVVTAPKTEDIYSFVC